MKVDDAVAERNAFDQFGHAVAAIELSPLRLGRHHQLERHGQARLAAEAPLGEKCAKVGDGLMGGISWRCRSACNSLARKGYDGVV